MSVLTLLKDQWRVFFIQFIMVFFTSIFMHLMGVAMPIIIIVEISFFIAIISGVFLEAYQRYLTYKKMNDTWNELEDKTYFSELIERPLFYEGQLLTEIIRQNERFMNQAIALQEDEVEDYKQYLSIWAHEIKTPISVMKILILNHPTELSEKLLLEIEKTEIYIEEILYYSKMENVAEDYRIRTVSLKSLVMEALIKNATIMTENQVYPIVEPIKDEVLTDSKWTIFIITQLILNAVKYRDPNKKAILRFMTTEIDSTKVKLRIIDHGIGISKEDLKNVFKKGYTGENGRLYSKSTGMGLYLCKKMCDQMGITIKIQSEKGKGTEVSLLFPKRENKEI